MNIQTPKERHCNGTTWQNYLISIRYILSLFLLSQAALTWNKATPCVLAHGHNDLRAAPLVLHPGMTEGRRVDDLESTESDRTLQVTVERNVPGLKTLSTRSRVGDGNVSTEQPRQTPERAASSHLWSYPLRQLLPPLTPKRWTGHCCGEEGCLAVLEVKKIMQQMFLILLPKRPILASRHFAGRDPATEKVCRSGRGSQTSRGNTYNEDSNSTWSLAMPNTIIRVFNKASTALFAHLRQDCLPLSRYKKTTAARILPLQPHVLGLKDSRPMRIPFWGILTSGYFSTNELLKCWKVLQLAHRWKLDTSKMVQCPTVVASFMFGWSYWDLGTLELRSSELLFLGFFFQNPWMRCVITCECSWVCLSQISLYQVWCLWNSIATRVIHVSKRM